MVDDPVTAADLKRWRTLANLTRRQAAAALNVPARTYENWEEERRAIPGPVERLCAYVTEFGPAQVAEGRVTGFERGR